MSFFLSFLFNNESEYVLALRRLKKIHNGGWEIVYRGTQRWDELGFGDFFPGYGRLYCRKFRVWYCDVGFKEEKDIQFFEDKYPVCYEPDNYMKLTGSNVCLGRLERTRGYEELFSGLDSVKRKRWYFALV